MNDREFDVLVIGAGPGGYVAAIRAAQLGLKVACVERMPTLGGTCLNVGCIPSKALLHTSGEYAHARSGLARIGVAVSGVELDLAAMMAHKDKVVSDLTGGVAGLLRKNGVTRLEGHARFAGPGTVDIEGPDAGTVLAGAAVIATGSVSAPLAGVEVDEERIVSSTGALALARVPARLAVIGAGYIGLEMGSVWSRLGAKVTVIEFLDRVLPGMDGEVATQMHRLLRRQKIAFRLGTRVVGAARTDEGVRLELAPTAGGEAATLDVDAVLVAVGRRPCTDGLGLDGLGIALDGQGRIPVDERFETAAPGVYAIGDVIAGPMLAHKAEEEGIAVAEIVAGGAAHVNRDAIPGVVYTAPEAAGVGLTEEALEEAGVDYTVGRFPFAANGRARAMSATEGFVKILADAGTDRVLGVHIVGHDAGTLIAEAVTVMEFGGSAEDIARTCHAHPSLNEAVKEAALAAAGRAIHV